MFVKRTVDDHCKTDPQIYYRVNMPHLRLSVMAYRYSRENVLLIYLKFCPFGDINLSQ